MDSETTQVSSKNLIDLVLVKMIVEWQKGVKLP